MAIEQVLMRSMKVTGELTRGRGILPSTIASWIRSMPASTKIVEAIEEFGDVKGIASEQHMELRESRQRPINFQNMASGSLSFD